MPYTLTGTAPAPPTSSRFPPPPGARRRLGTAAPRGGPRPGTGASRGCTPAGTTPARTGRCGRGSKRQRLAGRRRVPVRHGRDHPAADPHPRRARHLPRAATARRRRRGLRGGRRGLRPHRRAHRGAHRPRAGPDGQAVHDDRRPRRVRAGRKARRRGARRRRRLRQPPAVLDPFRGRRAHARHPLPVLLPRPATGHPGPRDRGAVPGRRGPGARRQPVPRPVGRIDRRPRRPARQPVGALGARPARDHALRPGAPLPPRLRRARRSRDAGARVGRGAPRGPRPLPRHRRRRAPRLHPAPARDVRAGGPDGGRLDPRPAPGAHPPRPVRPPAGRPDHLRDRHPLRHARRRTRLARLQGRVRGLAVGLPPREGRRVRAGGRVGGRGRRHARAQPRKRRSTAPTARRAERRAPIVEESGPNPTRCRRGSLATCVPVMRIPPCGVCRCSPAR